MASSATILTASIFRTGNNRQAPRRTPEFRGHYSPLQPAHLKGSFHMKFILLTLSESDYTIMYKINSTVGTALTALNVIQ